MPKKEEEKPLRALQSGDSDSEDEEPTFMEKLRDVDIKHTLKASSNRNWIYFRITAREMSKKKCGCCLGFSSCWIVVFSMSLLVSFLEHVPAIFFKLSESAAGEVDLTIQPNDDPYADTINYPEMAKVLNTLGAQSALTDRDDYYSYHAPRIRLSGMMGSLNSCQINNTYKTPDSNGMYDTSWRDCDSDGCVSCQMLAGEFVAIDVKLEETMGYGRTWDHGDIPPGQAVISPVVARAMEVVEGDAVLMKLDVTKLKTGVLPNNFTDELESVFVVTVYKISGSEGKLAKRDDVWMMTDMATIWPYILNGMNPTKDETEALTNLDLHTVATEVNINIPPDTRIQLYTASTDIAVVQKDAIEFITEIMYKLGFTTFQPKTAILQQMVFNSQYITILGLIVTLIGAILTLLSCILIYSLLMVDVETRTFQMGVLRMVGMERSGLVALVLYQAMFYSVFAWILGLVTGAVGMNLITRVFEDIISTELNKDLTSTGIFIATLLGLGIPLLSSAIPIRHALGQNLQDSLDTTHSKTNAVEINVERADVFKINPAIVVAGFMMALFGFLIYYILPMALLSFNLSLMLYIFFSLLLGMLFGMVLLSLNLETLFELFITNLFFFWENRAVRTLINKNLIAHRSRNRKTTIMYAVSLAFVVWISVTFDLQIATAEYASLRRFGTRIYIAAGSGGMPMQAAEKLDAILTSDPIITDHAWMTIGNEGDSQTKAYSIGRFNNQRVAIYGVSPNFYSVTGDEFLLIDDQIPGSGTLSEKLYNIRGSSSSTTAATWARSANLRTLEDQFVVQSTEGSFSSDYVVFKPIGVLSNSPILATPANPSQTSAKMENAVSIPAYLRLVERFNPTTDKTASSLRMIRCSIKLADDATESQIATLKQNVVSAIGQEPGISDLRVYDLNEDLSDILQASKSMDLVFMMTTIIAMLMCFFSLTSSMGSNIYEQSKEVGVLRALGLIKGRVTRLYIWEAFTLVQSASLMGTLTGTTIAFTMALQRSLFSNLPLPFRFPWLLQITVCVTAMVTAILASYSPIKVLLNKPVIDILKTIQT